MGLMNVLHNLVVHEHGSPDDQCALLVEVVKADRSSSLVTVKCARSEIEGICHQYRDNEDTVEVTVFQRIYHAKKEPEDPVVDAEAAVLANAALGVMKL